MSCGGGGVLVSRLGTEPRPMEAEHGVLTIRPPGKSQLVEKERRTHITHRGQFV